MKLSLTIKADIKEAIVHDDGYFEALVRADVTGSSNIMFVDNDGHRQLTYEGWFTVHPKNKLWLDFSLSGSATMTGCKDAPDDVEQIIQQVTSNILSNIKAIEGQIEIKTINITAEPEEKI